MPSDPSYQSKAWIAVRNRVRTKWARDGKPCSFCGQAISKGERVIVDHTFNRKQHPHINPLDEQHLTVQHHACHSRKTKWVDYSSKDEVGIDGLPKGSDWG